MHEDDRVLVTLLDRADVPEPSRVGGRVVLEPASPIVWFTFPGAWHDIGRFHLADGTFTGLYANVLTPVEIRNGDDGDDWFTTDLFLDVFAPPGAPPVLLDRDELDQALARGDIPPELADRATREAERMLQDAARGVWPPAVVAEWTLARARSAAR